jgi:multisubunit Na+/H+ antiporter MnhB subunit
MAYEREQVEARVSQRILWIGAEAYPVHNIVRAQTIALLPRRRAAVWRFIWTVVVWAVLGFAGLVAISNLELPDVGINLGLVLTGVVILLTVVSSIRLIRVLMIPTRYALVVETAGTAHTALVSSEEWLVTKLVRGIMDAINNPQAEVSPIIFTKYNTNLTGGNVGIIGDHGQIDTMS